ncbi:hypothetical protein QJ856_gp0451 [Tupanvirus deep ocean]|uniref:Uncharacterized protein n=2 Tax=Tupanvirus TaxID=2094720 RepID=A0AC62A9E2_9VIRU|nr:hypothetical protein QJ856_gp0451 [Tupanvirus deep ocean]QKU34293.1 hypothetical protein [Tupanvirus deep ocean]
MDFQYMNNNQINSLDYFSLVNMLMNQISPETRKQILDRLTEMNNQLMMGMNSQIQTDLQRSSMLSSRKKDATEIQHPSLDRLNYKGPNPLPLNIPMNGNNQFAMNNPYQMSSMMPALAQMPSMMMPVNNYGNMGQYNNNRQPIKDTNTEIDLDDIIDEIQEEPDSLDKELTRIKKLHTKIVADKRRRRKEREAISLQK